jgi:hypothetical protein
MEGFGGSPREELPDTAAPAALGRPDATIQYRTGDTDGPAVRPGGRRPPPEPRDRADPELAAHRRAGARAGLPAAVPALLVHGQLDQHRQHRLQQPSVGPARAVGPVRRGPGRRERQQSRQPRGVSPRRSWRFLDPVSLTVALVRGTVPRGSASRSRTDGTGWPRAPAEVGSGASTDEVGNPGGGLGGSVAGTPG